MRERDELAGESGALVVGGVIACLSTDEHSRDPLKSKYNPAPMNQKAPACESFEFPRYLTCHLLIVRNWEVG